MSHISNNFGIILQEVQKSSQVDFFQACMYVHIDLCICAGADVCIYVYINKNICKWACVHAYTYALCLCA